MFPGSGKIVEGNWTRKALGGEYKSRKQNAEVHNNTKTNPWRIVINSGLRHEAKSHQSVRKTELPRPETPQPPPPQDHHPQTFSFVTYVV
jgi:hypothetical protein